MFKKIFLSSLISAKLEIKTILQVVYVFRKLNQISSDPSSYYISYCLHLPFICVKLNRQHNLYFICKVYICDRCIVIWKIHSIMDRYIAIGKDNVSTAEISWLMESSFSELPQFWSNKSLINYSLILQTSVSYKVSENELRFHGLFFALVWFC